MAAKKLGHLIFRSLVVLLLTLIVGTVTLACRERESDAITQSKTHWSGGNTFADQGKWAEAIEEYNRAIELDPNSDRAYESRGAAYISLGDLDRAIGDLNKAIELAPDRGGPVYYRGIAYRQQGSLDQAIDDFSKIIGDRSRTLWRGALYQRGLAYKRKGVLSEAKADFERILELEAARPGEGDKEWVNGARKELAELGQ